MLAGEVHHLRHFCFRHFVGEHAAFADAMLVDVQHDARRRPPRSLLKYRSSTWTTNSIGV